jgi:ubiquinone/menaquinone biosynthesis C-methylase UbiE
MKNFRLKVNKIINKTKKIRVDKFNFNLIINYLIYFNLKIENILFDKKNYFGNPLVISKKYVDDLENFIFSLDKLKKFSSGTQVKKLNFVRENSHKILFQKLWLNFSLKEYKRNRIDRYMTRIKVNNLQKIIKNKDIIDFGCGHGNFLIACLQSGAKYCHGIDYGKDSINFAKKILDKLDISKSKICFKVKTAYKTGVKSSSFDFAIQNGVFHHMNNELKAYKEVYRVLKPGGYFWLYTDGGGGIRDITLDMSQKILANIDKNYVVEKIKQAGLVYNKEYHLGDGMNAEYRHTTFKKIKKTLGKIGFENFKQLNGGFYTDIDKPFYKDKFFDEKFGSGDLRILCQKKLK